MPDRSSAGGNEETSLHELIQPAERTNLVRAAVGRPSAEVVSWFVQPIHGMGGGACVYRVSGEARAGGEMLSWSAVVKVFSLDGVGIQAAARSPREWDYWKREWLIYQAPWHRGLGDGLVAPRCLGIGEQVGVAAWVAMEDLADLDQRPWPLSKFGMVAHHVGGFNGAFLAQGRLPSDPWLNVDWLRGWTERVDPVATLSAAADHPWVRRVFSPDMCSAVISLWQNRGTFFDALDSLPRTMCHRDLFPRNAFVQSSPVGDRTVAIDWAYCGIGPIGSDLVPLVEASLTWFEVDHARAAELERCCLDGYLEGLRSAGWSGPVRDVQLGYLASLVLRIGLGGSARIVSVLTDSRLHPWAEHAFGYQMETIVNNLRATMDFVYVRISAARSLLEA